QPADPTQALQDLLTAPETNEGALELSNGVIGEKRVAPTVDNVIQRDALYPFNYPTNGLPSPLFGAQEWTQKMMLFEEFGTEKLAPAAVAGTNPSPRPTTGPRPEQAPTSVAASGPASASLDAFLSQAGISPFPMRESNTDATNPWQPDVEAFLNRTLSHPPAE